MGFKKGEELAIESVKARVMGAEVIDGGGEFNGMAQTGGEAGEGQSKAIEGGIAGEPVIGEKVGDGHACARGEEVEVISQDGVDILDKGGAGCLVRPMHAEEVIEEDIDKDGGITAPARFEKSSGQFNEGVDIGEGVDTAVEMEALLDFAGQAEAGAAFDPVGGEVANENVRGIG